MVDSYLLVFAGLLVTIGTLGDHFGRKKALLAGLALFGGASLAVLFVQSAMAASISPLPAATRTRKEHLS